MLLLASRQEHKKPLAVTAYGFVLVTMVRSIRSLTRESRGVSQPTDRAATLAVKKAVSAVLHATQRCDFPGQQRNWYAA